jgi:signal transduction histidine kinase
VIGHPVRDLGFATLVAALVSAAAAIGYGLHAGLVTFEILAPLGWLTVLIGDRLIAHRTRLGGLRRQFAAIAVVTAAAMAIAIGLLVAEMFVSGMDAFFTILVAVYAVALAAWAMRRIGRRALRDVDAVRATLAAVAEGERDVRTGVVGNDEIARLAADVDAMVARLDVEERARRTLFAAVSHDLRTPITALQLLANALDDGIVEDAETRREYAVRMGTHVRALGALIDDLFELTRLESGDLTWTMEQVRLDELLSETVNAMRPAAEARAVAVSARVDGLPPAARANPEQLQRVLFNLIQNAIRHTPPDGSVTVSAEAAVDGIEVEVADTGDGIAAEHRERIFDPFYRVDPSRRDAGAGLGLAISRAIVEAHGGRIWLADAAVGTRVRFTLPARAGSPQT